MAETKTRRSLLDVVIDHYNDHKDSRCSRLMLCGLLEVGAANRVEQFHTDFFKEHANEAVISGVQAILNGAAVVQVLEASNTKMLTDLMRALLAAGLFQTVKVCSLSEEVPREFPVFASREINVPKEEFDNPADWAQCVFNTLRPFLSLARELATMEESKAINYVQTTTSHEFTQKIPTVDRIKGFCAASDICTVEEWLEIFDSPIAFTLESELVWPVEPFLKY